MPPVTARRWAALLFFPLLAVWTWLLVEPYPVPQVVGVVPPAWRLVAAKILHAGVYAALTALGWVWPPTPGIRWAVVGVLLSHGAGTEIAQTFVPNRDGRVWDVVIDWAGVAVGLTGVRAVIFRHLNR